jgi:hypothetical protein
LVEAENSLKVTYGQFDVTGTITLNDKSFGLDKHGKANPNYTYSQIDIQMKNEDGDTFFLNAMDGFDSQKGKTLYARDKDGNNIKISFADRKNQTIIEQIDNRSFVSVALTKEEPDESGFRRWKYENFLALYDAIAYLQPRLETGMKLRVTGQTRYNTYNGDTQKNFSINNIYLLDETDTYKSGFIFRQNVILKHDDVDLSEWEENNVAKVNAHILIKSHQKFEMLPLELSVRADPDKKDTYKRVIDKFLTVDEDKVRRINIEGKYHRGFVASQVTEEDLPDEAKELIEDGLYSQDEVLKMYANRENVDEMIITRPVIYKGRNDARPSVDMADDEILLTDIEALDTDVPWDEDGNAKDEKEEDTKSPDEENDLSFLDDLE